MIHCLEHAYDIVLRACASWFPAGQDFLFSNKSAQGKAFPFIESHSCILSQLRSHVKDQFHNYTLPPRHLTFYQGCLQRTMQHVEKMKVEVVVDLVVNGMMCRIHHDKIQCLEVWSPMPLEIL